MANFRRNALWNAAGNLIYMACQWIVTVLVTKFGSFGEAGILSLAMSVSATFQTVALFGIRSYQVSDIEEKFGDSSYVALRALTCLAAMVLCLGFSLAGGYFGGQLLAIFLFMTFRLAENYSDVLHGVAQRKGRLDLAGKSFAVKGVGLLAGFCASYFSTHSLLVGIASMAGISVLSTILFDLPLTRALSSYRLTASLSDCLALGKKSLPLCLYMFLFSSLSTVPKILLERMSGEEVLGAYSSIFAPALLLSAMAGYLYNPFIPAFAERLRTGDVKGFAALAGKITAAILLVGGLSLVADAFFGEFGLKLLFGEKILPHVSMLAPILIAIFTNAILAFFCVLSIVLRDFLFLLIACGAGLLTELLASRPLISSFGADGASYALIAASLLASLILLARMAQTLEKEGRA